ncbi:MAG: winged helix-turn-helix transcriptional regulator [Candidatus Pacearchaeota archaeon]
MVRISNLKLISLLEKNSRISLTELAKIFKVSDTAIRKRIKKLEKEGIIKKYTVEVDWKKLGYGMKVVIGIDTLPEKLIDVIETLKNKEEISSIESSSGDHMILINYFCKDSFQLKNFISYLKKLKGITRICPAIVIERIK